jgi:serine/threonine protein phosphatase 1
MSHRTIAIGDIHGCAAALSTLIEAIAPEPDDLIVPLGDYVDRGPDTKTVIDQLIELDGRCRMAPLLGNHELMMLGALESLDSLRFWLSCGGAETLESYGGDLENISPSHLDFLRGCLAYNETAKYLFFHANFDPRLPPDEQPERLLFWEHLVLYENGTHTIPSRHFSEKVAFVGHTPQENGEILDLDDIICIDTHCVGSGCLTAIDCDTRKTWRADKDGRLLER